MLIKNTPIYGLHSDIMLIFKSLFKLNYMKYLYALILFMCVTGQLRAQDHKYQNIADQFFRYYNSNQVDSIYGLFDEQMRAALDREKTSVLIGQIRGQLGQILKSRYMGTPASELYEYRMSFEKPLVDLSLMLKGGQIAGIGQKEPERKEDSSEKLRSPDNFVLKVPMARLSGTLTMPKRTGKVPVVLLISGSGPTDRNMNQGVGLKTNSFLQLAEGLAEKGIASVRYDKRGVGKSLFSGEPEKLTFDDFIGDATLFIDSLKKDPRFSRVIVAGHSEGSAIGLMAALNRKPAGFISLSGYATDMIGLLRKQLRSAISPAEFKMASEVLDSLKAGKTFQRPLPGVLGSLLSPVVQPFLISNAKYIAKAEISKLKIPILIVSGTHDLQVGIEDARQLNQAAPGSRLKLIAGMNHVLKNAPEERTANLATYNKPELPLHPELVPAVTQFILQLK